MPSREHRKIIRMGASQGITLPKPFLDYHKVKDGEEMLLLYDNIILVLPRGVSEEVLEKKANLIKELLG